MHRSRELIDDPDNVSIILPFGTLTGSPGSYNWLTSSVNVFGRYWPDPTSSKLEDEVTRGVYRYQDCDHVKFTGKYYASILGITPGQVIYYTTPSPAISAGAKSYSHTCRTFCDKASSLTKRVVGTYSSESLTRLFASSSLPRKITIDRDPFDNGFSIWYTLVDLFDLKKALIKLASNPKLSSLKKGAKRRLIPKKDTARQLADAHLSVRFGVIPTIQDVQDTIQVIKTWHDVYDQMDELLSKRYRKHENVPDIADPVLFGEWKEIVSFSLPGNSINHQVLVESKTKVRWHGLTLYGFTCPEFQGWLSRLAQICDSFGVLDPAALWDVVPFSFIVDWFFTTQSFLHKLKPRLFPATAVIHDYLESIVMETTVTYKLLNWAFPLDPPGSGPPAAFINSTLIGVESYKTYVRRRFLPDLANVSLSSGIARKSSFVTLNRVAISASLLAQRVPR